MKIEQTVKVIFVRQCLTLISLIVIPLALALIVSQTLSAQLQVNLDLGDAPDAFLVSVVKTLRRPHEPRVDIRM